MFRQISTTFSIRMSPQKTPRFSYGYVNSTARTAADKWRKHFTPLQKKQLSMFFFAPHGVLYLNKELLTCWHSQLIFLDKAIFL